MKRRFCFCSFLILLEIGSCFATTGTTVKEFRALRDRDFEASVMLLRAMRESIFYAQKSIGSSAPCLSPLPMSDGELMSIFESELLQRNANKEGIESDQDKIAFILVNALKKIWKMPIIELPSLGSGCIALS